MPLTIPVRTPPAQVEHGIQIGTERVLTIDDRALGRALRACIRGEVRFSDGDRAVYSTDASNYRMLPIGVVLPRDIDDVIERLRDGSHLLVGASGVVCPAVGKPAKPNAEPSRRRQVVGRHFTAPATATLRHCGMAGSFGFEAEHYDVSLKVGERVLLPAVRASEENTLIIADGFSCREQIGQTTGRRALHLAQVLQLALHQDKNSTRRHSKDEVELFAPSRMSMRRASPRAAVIVAASVAAGAVLLWALTARKAT
jgi:hypothetical protein